MTDNKQQDKQALISTTTKPFWWMMLMFICSVVYLFPEAVFNAALTDVAGGRASSEADLREVELFGRTISGIGVTLLLADLLLKGRWLSSVVRALLGFSLLAVLVWPTVFFGQKWLVDRFIVDASSPEERQQAYLSQIIRSALIEKSVQFEGIEYDPTQAHSPTEKAFLSVFGGLVYADEHIIGTLESRKTEIMEKFVRDHAMARFDEHYGRYDNFRLTLQQHYREYAKGSAKYNQAIASSPERAEQYWLETQNEVKKGWEKYQQAENAYEARVDSRAQQIAPKIYHYFEERSECREYDSKSRKQRCFEQLQAGYDREIKKYGIGYIPADDWLRREEVSTAENIGTSLIAGVMTMGLYTALQAADAVMGGDANMKDHRFVYTNDVSHYKDILMVKMEPNFIKESGGYPLGITSVHQFRQHTVTSNKVRSSLVKKGLTLPKEWQLSQRLVFDSAVANKVRQQADANWYAKMKNKGSQMPPNLSWKAFQKESEVQNKIKQQMGDLYVSPTLADWNNRQFQQQVIEVNIKRKTQEYLKILKAQQQEFADGGSLASTGKSALRATIIPPISMTISLVLVLLTVLKLPLKVMELISALKSHNAAPNRKPKWYNQLGVSLSLFAAIFVVPLSIGSNQYTHSDSSLNYFFEQMEKNDSATISYALKWLLITQPLAQPVGTSIDNTLKITQGFDAISAPIDYIDILVLPEHEELQPTSSKAVTPLLPLTIDSNIDNVKISVMNIKPRYQPGMKLPAGAYDIKVSAPGYEPVRQWVYLKPEQTKFIITL